MYEPQRFLTIHLTRLCNSHCRFCATDALGGDPGTLSLEQVEQCLRQHAGQGFEAVSLIGGEPTMVRYLPEVLTLIRRYGYPMTQMFTNGRRLAHRPYAEHLVRSGISLFVISLHGHTPELHDGLTGSPGSFRQALQGIANARALGQGVKTVTVVTRQNHRFLKDVLNVLLEAQVEVVEFLGLCPGGQAAMRWSQLAVRYRESFPFLQDAIHTGQAAGRTVALEGFPFCALRPYEKLCVEYANTRRERMLFHGHLIEDYDTFLNATHKLCLPQCRACPCKPRCGGVYTGYHYTFGGHEFSPFADAGETPRGSRPDGSAVQPAGGSRSPGQPVGEGHAPRGAAGSAS